MTVISKRSKFLITLFHFLYCYVDSVSLIHSSGKGWYTAYGYERESINLLTLAGLL